MNDVTRTSKEKSPMQELREIVENQAAGRQFLPVEMALLRRAVSAPEPPAVPARVRLLKDIYDDGEDHHPPGYIAKRGEVVEVREVRALAVAHEGVTDNAFVVRSGEFEPVPALPPAVGWIDAKQRKPTHIYSVLGWLIGPYNIAIEEHAEIVAWNPDRKQWQCGGYGDDDVDVQVSHWMDLPASPSTKGEAP